MHITTFYSFKGGVGRTQALVNVGVELARRGRRVLLVDFDLEAPGVDSFPLPRPQQPSPGLVEFVTSYRLTGRAPDASNYIYECPGVGQENGRLWIMPAGTQDDTYAKRLSQIDWQWLYAEGGGYLLFEDLKLQWKRSIEPDYVLVDSRTGHTDVAGICTRQLPDAVVILFFPTDQNLRGLPKIISDIRAEALGPRKKHIQLDFVMANIPDLDDEDQILERRIETFAQTLKYHSVTGIIHRYDSLALLNQVVFTADRPKSRLAREYSVLADSIVEHNLRDREGALRFIKRLARRTRSDARKLSRTAVEERLKEIRRTHSADAAVIEQLADLRMREGRIEEATELWSELVGMGVKSPHVLLRRAEARRVTGNITGAVEDVNGVLASEKVADFEVWRALRVLAAIDPSGLRKVAHTPAIHHLDYDARLWLARQLQLEIAGLEPARDILKKLIEQPDLSTEQQAEVRNELAICLMGMGQSVDAAAVLESIRNTSLVETFNYAMATWSQRAGPDPVLFQRVLELDDDNGSANYAQCLAVALAVLGKVEEARARLYQARERMTASPIPTFSCWQYRIVSPEDFLAHLEAIKLLIDGEHVQPLFIERAMSH